MNSMVSHTNGMDSSEVYPALVQLAQYQQLGTPEEIAAKLAGCSTEVIDSFGGTNAFLSNFFLCEIILFGLIFTCVEAAFQAAKCRTAADRNQFVGIGARDAKRLGRKVALRDDWETIKVPVMRALVLQKFSRNAELRRQLLDTGNAKLVDGNGKNHLGRILMEVRTMLRMQDHPKQTLLPDGNILSVSIEDTAEKTGFTVALQSPDNRAHPLVGVYHRPAEAEPNCLTAEFLNTEMGLKYHFGRIANEGGRRYDEGQHST